MSVGSSFPHKNVLKVRTDFILDTIGWNPVMSHNSTGPAESVGIWWVNSPFKSPMGNQWATSRCDLPPSFSHYYKILFLVIHATSRVRRDTHCTIIQLIKSRLTLPAWSSARIQILWPPLSLRCWGSTLWSKYPPVTRTFFRFSCLNDENTTWADLDQHTQRETIKQSTTEKLAQTQELRMLRTRFIKAIPLIKETPPLQSKG